MFADAMQIKMKPLRYRLANLLGPQEGIVARHQEGKPFLFLVFLSFVVIFNGIL